MYDSVMHNDIGLRLNIKGCSSVKIKAAPSRTSKLRLARLLTVSLVQCLKYLVREVPNAPGAYLGSSNKEDEVACTRMIHDSKGPSLLTKIITIP